MPPVPPLDPARLVRRCDPAQFPFETTKDLPALADIVGQPRAVDAIEFGIGIDRKGFNLFAIGSRRASLHAVVRTFLDRTASTEPRPSDWCYVHNFELPHRPRALELPAGEGAKLKEAMTRLVDELRTAIAAAFEADEYRARRQEIEQEFEDHQERAFNELQEQASRIGLTVIRTPAGIAVAPLRNGQVITPEEFAKLPDEERKRINTTIEEIQAGLERILRQVPQWKRETARQIAELKRTVIRAAAGSIFDDLRRQFQSLPHVVAYLDAVRQDVIENAEDFRHTKETTPTPIVGVLMPESAHAVTLRRYEVNVLTQPDAVRGAPVVYEDHPTYPNLVGRIEHTAQMGTLVTDFTLIKPGALHRANGGYLVLDAREVLLQPYAWEGLKRALRAGEIRVESLGQALSLVSTVSLEPEPIRLDVKVVLAGERMIYYLLYAYDPEFADLFKVVVDFEDEMDRTPANELLYSRMLATVAAEDGLRPLSAGGVSRVVEQAARMTGDAERLSMNVRDVLDLLREADYWAAQADRPIIAAADVQRAVDKAVARHDRLHEWYTDEIQRDTILIRTDGAVVGQVNGLSVTELGSHVFGRPTRISARVRLGSGGVVDIEREVELGGPLHSKGVLILSGFLAGRYAPTAPLSLSATLVFEQSYGGVEGDSASSPELYALLSALAQAPVRQALAVTGSVNQHGEVQAIGGVNEKIEGFFDICARRGLTGEQGVLIPAANVKHLMLRADVVTAAAEGRFHIYAIETIDQGLELLTGVTAGERDPDGSFPPDSINQRVEARLTEFAERARAFRKQTDGAARE